MERKLKPFEIEVIRSHLDETKALGNRGLRFKALCEAAKRDGILRVMDREMRDEVLELSKRGKFWHDKHGKSKAT